VTDPSWLASNILTKDAAGTSTLESPQETIWIVPFSVSGTAGIVTTGTNIFTRSNGVTSCNGGNTDLSANAAVQVIFQVSWIEPSTKRSLSRATSTILSNGGMPH
jgi:hypothetical protein